MHSQQGHIKKKSICQLAEEGGGGGGGGGMRVCVCVCVYVGV